jgi:hypothetical protein
MTIELPKLPLQGAAGSDLEIESREQPSARPVTFRA